MPATMRAPSCRLRLRLRGRWGVEAAARAAVSLPGGGPRRTAAPPAVAGDPRRSLGPSPANLLVAGEAALSGLELGKPAAFLLDQVVLRATAGFGCCKD